MCVGGWGGGEEGRFWGMKGNRVMHKVFRARFIHE